MLEEAALTLAILAFALSVAAVVLARRRRADPTAEARRQLEALVEEETAVSAEELKSRLARLRADSLSTLAEDERRIADERRQELAERERAAGVELAEALAATAAPRRRAAARLDGRPRPDAAGAGDGAAASSSSARSS